jgi:hypothetical protein
MIGVSRIVASQSFDSLYKLAILPNSWYLSSSGGPGIHISSIGMILNG